jgi:hypothetical protein
MMMEKLVEWRPKYSEKTCPSATLSTTNPTWPDPGSNPGRRGGKPATNRLSYGAPEHYVNDIFVSWNRIIQMPTNGPAQLYIRNGDSNSFVLASAAVHSQAGLPGSEQVLFWVHMTQWFWTARDRNRLDWILELGSVSRRPTSCVTSSNSAFEVPASHELLQKVELISLFCIIWYSLTPWPLVRKRTIPTERPLLVGEVGVTRDVSYSKQI